jgi:hemoglobin-like flavoprotein
MTHQDWKDQRKADLASALLANAKPSRTNTAARTLAGVTPEEVSASMGINSEDYETVGTVKMGSAYVNVMRLRRKRDLAGEDTND